MNGTLYKRILAALCALTMILALPACGRGEDGTIPLVEGENFVVAVSQSPDTLNPVLSEGGLADEFFLLCYDPLWRINAAGEPVACLVEDYSLSSDSLTWTIRLRKDVTFADGTPLTSQDVALSYEMMESFSERYASYFEGITSIRCPDDYTVVIATEYVKGDMMYNPTPILPSSVWENYEFSPAGFDNATMIGSGPFIYDSAASGDGVWVFQARADYPQGSAHVGTVEFRLYSTSTAAARAVAGGEVDAGFGMTDVQLTTLEGVPNIELLQYLRPEGECWALVFNSQSPWFESASMGQALEQCADREWILSMACGGAGMIGSSFVVPGTNYFSKPSGLLSYDLTSALLQLQAKGYLDIDDDGILETTKEYDLNLIMVSSSEDPWAATAGTILVSDLKEIGVAVDWQQTDGSVLAACDDPDEWDMCLLSWQGSRNPVTAATAFRDTMEELSGWTSSAYDGLLIQLRSATDEQTVRSLSQQLQQLVYTDCPCVVLAYPADVQAIRKDIWTGYEDLLACGGLFAMGSYDVYMNVMPVVAEPEK